MDGVKKEAILVIASVHLLHFMAAEVTVIKKLSSMQSFHQLNNYWFNGRDKCTKVMHSVKCYALVVITFYLGDIH